MTVFTETIVDGLNFSVVIHDDVEIAFYPGTTIAANMAVHDAASFAYRAGATNRQNLGIHDAVTARGVYKATIAQLLTIHPSVAKAVVALIADGFKLHDAMTLAYGSFIVEQLGLHDAATALAHSKLSLSDGATIHDSLAWVLGAFIMQNMGVHDTLTPQWMWSRTINSNLGIHDAVSPSHVVLVVLGDNLELTDTAALQAIYTSTIADGFTMSMAFIDPGGGITTWAINTRTSAITEYQNYAFNSFAQLGHHFLGASSQGLFQLDGHLDNAASIVARIKSGSAQFSGSRFTAFDAAYLGCRVSDGAADWILKLHAGDGRVYCYKFRPLNRRTTKVFFGKGLRARYFSWELITAGEELDLDSIEFVPIGSRRRV